MKWPAVLHRDRAPWRWLRPGPGPDLGADPVSVLALRLHGDLSAQGGARSVLVTAADDDAVGLDTTLELAWCLAEQGGHTVLLVDGAFGNDGLGAALGVAGLAGLTDWLDAGSASVPGPPAALASLIQPTGHERIHVLPQGDARKAATVRARALPELIAQAGGQHDFVLVFSSLQGDVHRALAFSPVVDAALLVAVEEQTLVEQITRGQRLLDDCGARRVALVLAARAGPARAAHHP